MGGISSDQGQSITVGPAGGRQQKRSEAGLREEIPRWLRDWIVDEEGALPSWVPAAMGKNASRQLGPVMRRLAMDQQDARDLEDLTARDVADARELGATWQLVGLGLGLSAEGARSRYGRRFIREEAVWEEDDDGDDADSAWSPLSP